jgi:catechol 2,3-dioxygenase-like lactoylglutathione lyase family enzyme
MAIATQEVRRVLPVALSHPRRNPDDQDRQCPVLGARPGRGTSLLYRFYTKTLGWEVRADVSMQAWNFRWLAVGPAGQDDVGLVLMPVPGPPPLDPDSRAALAGLVAKGAGGTLFLETDDCQASYEELPARGVTFNDPPTAQPYGIDISFRDPSGNNIRLTQVLDFDPARGTAP